jgi:hypothetical protein
MSRHAFVLLGDAVRHRHSTGSAAECERFAAMSTRARGAPLATGTQGMRHPSLASTLVLLAVIAIGTAIDARASSTEPPFPHIRTAEPRLRALIDDAVTASATVRALVDRITASDVVVFVTCEPTPHTRIGGRLNFMTTAGGFRYVVIRLKTMHRVAAIAMLAHELQHAAEVADTPAIVDEASLAREYARIGYRRHALHGLAFDTKAAVEVGRRVVDELAAGKAEAGD